MVYAHCVQGIGASEASQFPAGTETPPNTQRKRRRTIIDVGSGCGRLALYMALSLVLDDDCSWDIHGIEISPIYHKEAIQAVQRAIDYGYIIESSNDMNNNINNEQQNDSLLHNKNTIQFHNGPADLYKELIQNADIIFCYSTTFANGGFAINEQAMVFDTYWSEIFSTPTDGVVITTEKIINPYYGFSILDRIDVPNPEVFESTGYIQRRKTEGCYILQNNIIDSFNKNLQSPPNNANAPNY